MLRLSCVFFSFFPSLFVNRLYMFICSPSGIYLVLFFSLRMMEHCCFVVSFAILYLFLWLSKGSFSGHGGV